MTQTTVKWRQNTTCGHNIRPWAFEGYINRRQHQSPCLCLFSTLLFLQVNQSGSPLTHWRPYINWWSVRAWFYATDWPQQLQTKPQCLQSSWVRLGNRGGNRKREEEEKNDQGKWDHNGAHRNSGLKTWNCHSAGPGRGFRCCLCNEGETVWHVGDGEEEKGGGQRRRLNHHCT